MQMDSMRDVMHTGVKGDELKKEVKKTYQKVLDWDINFHHFWKTKHGSVLARYSNQTSKGMSG